MAEILAEKGADLNTVTKAGYSPLHVATHFGSVSLVKYLLDQQVTVNGQNELGYTPLHQAAQQGHSQIVNLLLETGRASPNTVSNVSIYSIEKKRFRARIKISYIINFVTELL